ncbi:cytochrome P450 [Pirellulales bacterium]|nr:cytochrome P450 [Pirellulales bacterium]
MNTTLPYESVDSLLLSRQYVESPYEIFDTLREQYPVFWSDQWNAWVVTRYENVMAILKDHKRFSNRGRYTEYLSSLSDGQRQQLTYLEHHYEHGGLVQSDPPSHTRLRKLIGNAFTPRMVQHMRDLVEQIVADLLDAFVGRREIDLIYEFAFPLPATVIAGMLGVATEERDQFKEWSAAIQRFLGSGQVNFEFALAAQEAWRNMNDHFASLLAERRNHPREDLVSAMAQACEDGESLSDDELIRTCGALLVAGHETTTNLISNAIWLLLGRPDQLDLLRNDDSLYPAAVEEFLRYESPFQSLPRTLTENVALRGQTMRRGQLAYVMIGAANRDPDRFDRPHELDITRADNKQLAFGHGTHFCLGAPLARLEASIAIREVFDQFPNMQLDPDRPPVWKESMVQRGMERFDLSLH